MLSSNVLAWSSLTLLVLLYSALSLVQIALATMSPATLVVLEQLPKRRRKRILQLVRDSESIQSALRLGRLTCLVLLAVTTLPELLERIEDALPAGSRVWTPVLLLLLGLLFATAAYFLGEFLPRRTVPRRADAVLTLASPWLSGYVLLLSPLLALINGVGGLLLRLLGIPPAQPPRLTREEIELLVERGMQEGVLEPVETHMLTETLRLGDRRVRQLMRPRIDLDAADVNTPPEEILGIVAMAGYSRLPVYDGDLDHIVGYIHTKDVLRQQYLGWPMELKKLTRPALFVPETMTIDQLLITFRTQRTHLAIVVDEYGGTKGMVTLDDVVEEIVGHLHTPESQMSPPRIVPSGDGIWLVDGNVTIAEFLTAVDAEELLDRAPKSATTVAGLVLEVLGRLPEPGEKDRWEGFWLEVVDMDQQRIEKVRVVKDHSTSDG